MTSVQVFEGDGVDPNICKPSLEHYTFLRTTKSGRYIIEQRCRQHLIIAGTGTIGEGAGLTTIQLVYAGTYQQDHILTAIKYMRLLIGYNLYFCWEHPSLSTGITIKGCLMEVTEPTYHPVTCTYDCTIDQ